MIAAFIFSGLPDTEIDDPSMLLVFASASLAICAMILPGVSGSFLLLIVGMYEPTLDAVHDRDLAYLAVFMAGAVVGLSVFAMLLRWLLAHVHDLTMAALVGLMIGSLRALWPFLEEDRGLRMPEDGDPVALAAALAIGGLVFVLALTRLSDGAEAPEEPTPMEARR
jgi:putative membrane protein